MKIPAVLPCFMVLLVLAAGCTQQPAPQPAATTAVTTPATAATPAVPADLARSWKLILMATKGGTAVWRPDGAVTLSLRQDGTLSGHTGCNGYSAGFTLTGESLPKGSGIDLMPVEATAKYCAPIADEERVYLATLQDAASYRVNGDKLTLTAKNGNELVYQWPESLK